MTKEAGKMVHTCSGAAFVCCVLGDWFSAQVLLLAQILQVRRYLHSLGYPDRALPQQLPITTKGCSGSWLVTELDKAKALAKLAG